MAYTRLIVKITKENLWLYVLRMLLERPMYAYEISKSLKEKFGFTTAMVTVYVVLYKMQREGLVQLEETENTIERTDRKYYQITQKGKETLQKGKSFLEDVVKRLS